MDCFGILQKNFSVHVGLLMNEKKNILQRGKSHQLEITAKPEDNSKASQLHSVLKDFVYLLTILL